MNAPLIPSGDNGFLFVDARSNPLTLPPGTLTNAINLRLDRGMLQPRRGSAKLADNILINAEQLALDFNLAADKAVTSLTYAFGIVTVNCPGHGVSNGQMVNLNGKGPDGWFGDFRMTVIDVDHLTYALPAEPVEAATGVTADGVEVTSLAYAGGTVTAVAVGHGFATGRVPNIKGRGASQWFGSYPITVVDADHFTYAIPEAPSAAASDVVLNAGPVLYEASGEAIHALEVFQSDFVQDAKQWLVAVATTAAYLLNFDAGGEYLIPTADSTDVTADDDTITVDAAAPGVPTIYLSFPDGETVDDDDTLSVLQTADGLYILRGREAAGEWAWREVTAGNVTYAAGVVTVVFVAHGFLDGQRVATTGADQEAYNVQADITVIDADTFTYPIGFAPATPATGSIWVRRVKAPLVWPGTGTAFQRVPGGSNPDGDTYERLPASGVACQLNGQVVVLDGRNNVQVMNVGSPNEGDPFQKAFSANLGGNDAIVALAPYTDNQLFIPGSRTLYGATIVLDNTGTSIDYAASKLRELSRAFGCAAKDSVQVTGTAIYWLSNYGVHSLSNLDSQDLALRALMEPISKPIEPWIGEINWAYAHRSKSAWHNSAYYLAVPTGDAQWPNEIFVWSAIAGGWVSRDQYPFAINHLKPAQFDGQERLYAATRDGGIYLLEERNFGDQYPGGARDIVARAEGRMLDWQSHGRKRVTRLFLNASLCALGGSVTGSVRGFNPDNVQVVASEVNAGAQASDEDITRRVNMRTNHAQFILELLGAETMVRRAILEASIALQEPVGGARTES